jgi:hypothetical protein
LHDGRFGHAQKVRKTQLFPRKILRNLRHKAAITGGASLFRAEQESPQAFDQQGNFAMRQRFVARAEKIRLYFPVKTESAGRP